MQWVGLMALFVGMLGFAIGYFGPKILMLEAKQGPLIGMFVTGPGGAIIGADIGYKKSNGAKGKGEKVSGLVFFFSCGYGKRHDSMRQ